MSEKTPRAFTTDGAIDYLGGKMSPATFRNVVAPNLRRVIITPRNVRYLREDLDRYVDRVAGVETQEEAQDAPRSYLDTVLAQ